MLANDGSFKPKLLFKLQARMIIASDLNYLVFPTITVTDPNNYNLKLDYNYKHSNALDSNNPYNVRYKLIV